MSMTLVRRRVHTTRGATPPPTKRLRPRDFRAHARFRHALRRFIRFSEQQARAAGLTPVQHQLLLAIRGSRRGWMTVGEVASELMIRPHSAVGLVHRAQRDGFVHKEQDAGDLRRMRVGMTDRGEAVIAELTAAHRFELMRLWRRIPNLG